MAVWRWPPSRAGWDVRCTSAWPSFPKWAQACSWARTWCAPAGLGLQKALQQVAAFPDRLRVRCALSGAELGVLPWGARRCSAMALFTPPSTGRICGLLHTGVRATPMPLACTRAWPLVLHLTPAARPRSFRGRDGGVGAQGAKRLRRCTHWRRWLVEPHAHATAGLPGPACDGAPGVPRLVRQNALPGAAHDVTAWLGPRLHMVQYPVRRGELQNLVVIVTRPAPRTWKPGTTTPTRATWNSGCWGTCTAATRRAWLRLG